MSNTTRQVKPLATRAAVGTVNVEKRTVEVVWSTGAKVLRSSWLDGPYFEELDMGPGAVRLDRLQNGAPFLADHNGYNVARTLGVVESARLENGKGIATVRFAKAEDDPEADKVFRKVVDGIIRSVSVGYRVHRVEKIETEGEKIPTLRVVDWTPYEISAVALPADAGAGFRSDEPTNEITITTVNPEKPTMDEEKKRLEAEALAKRQAEETEKRNAEIRAETLKIERERTSAIRSAVKAARLGDAFAEKLIDDGIATDKARALVLEELAIRDAEIKTEPAHVRIESVKGGDALEKFQRMALSLILTRGASDLVQQAQAKKVAGFDGLDAGELRGFTFVDLARECLERTGTSTKGMDRQTILSRALTMRGAAGGPYSGIADFPVLLENVIGKSLMGAYMVTNDTWSAFCKVETVPDFRDSPRYRAGSLTVLDSLNENGEFRNKSIPDGLKYPINVATKGNMISVSRQLLINDDMSALTDLGAKLGRAARLSVEVDVYALLALNAGLGPTQSDSQPFFNAANRANVNAAGSALSIAGLDADRIVMASQRDISNNEFLDLRPSVLLVPIGLGGQARELNDAQYNVGESNKFMTPNRIRGLFRTIIDTPRLTGTRRYLFTNPSEVPAIVVAFLEGQGQGPVLETQDGWRTDGTEMKVRFDYRAQMFDPKGAVTNAGA
jgi:HK97 family phage prohead protease